LIYRDKPYESYHKDYQFGMLTMREHWSSGLTDIRATLGHPEWLEKPSAEQPFVTHDLHRERRGWANHPPPSPPPLSRSRGRSVCALLRHARFAPGTALTLSPSPLPLARARGDRASLF